MIVEDSQMLMLSGIQHYMFCPRQWALIHIEQAWEENAHTAQGALIHQHADDPFYRTRQGDKRIVRRMAIASRQLGLYGFADIVECDPSPVQSCHTIQLNDTEGHWIPTPIEYKKGRPKKDECDIMQVVAQAMCLEEMFSIKVAQGALYYNSTRRREVFEITDNLRNKAVELSRKMHDMMLSGKVPPAEYSAGKCSKCSLIDICMPNSYKNFSVADYLKKHLYSDEETS